MITKLEKGMFVTIKSQGLTVKGKVISAEYWGEKDGWYIEMIDTDGNYRYWKQGQDGGELLSIEDKTHQQEVREAVQNLLDDEFNLHDGSVGIYPIGEIDQDLVKWINEDVEGFTVSEWDKYSLTIECEGVFVKVDLKDGYWTIVD